jgi:beta-ureidopropionase / N-carbamoyl-L-amino-acid hydrolase
VITTEGLSARLRELGDIGVGPDGVYRLAWTEEDAATRAWFERQAAASQLAVARDPAGNLWARPSADPPWWGIGSHLDSVRGGGRFDGPLGVACAFEIAAGAAEPIAVVSFADEEGARFNTPTFGSKALSGRLDLPAVLSRRDDGGVVLSDAMRAAGVDPDGIGAAPGWLAKLAGFIEVHIDQTTELAGAGEPVGVVSSLAARTRLEVVLRGRADHAGTTPSGERRDALAAAARLIVGAEDLAERDPSLTVTTSRILAKPNAPTTIAAEVRLYRRARTGRFCRDRRVAFGVG